MSFDNALFAADACHNGQPILGDDGKDPEEFLACVREALVSGKFKPLKHRVEQLGALAVTFKDLHTQAKTSLAAHNKAQKEEKDKKRKDAPESSEDPASQEEEAPAPAAPPPTKKGKSDKEKTGGKSSSGGKKNAGKNNTDSNPWA